MFTTLLLILCIAFCQSTLGQESSQRTLVQSSLIIRHGEANPDSRSTFSPETLFQALSVLTERGFIETQRLGQWYKTHVGSLLADNGENVWVESTQRPRSVESARAIILGLVGNESDVNVNSRLMQFDDRFDYKRCNKSDQLQKIALESDEAMQIVQDNQDIFDFLRQHDVPEDLLKVENFWKNADGLRSRKEQDIPRPAYLTEEREAEIEQVTNLLWELQYNQTEVTKLSIAVLLNDIVNEIEQVIRPTSCVPGPRKPILIFAGHHNTMWNMLNGLRLFGGEYVELSSALAIDLVQDESDQYFVRIEYKKGRNFPNSEVMVPRFCENQNTEHGCPVEVFLAHVRHNLLTSVARTVLCQGA